MMDKRDDTARQAALDGEAWLNRQEVFLDADQRVRAFADALVHRALTVWVEAQDAALEAERRKKSVGGPP
jgi:hypothetical protein